MARVFGNLSLPPFFAQQVLNCQIQMDLNNDIHPDIMIQFLQLCATGIEYYSSIKSYKYLYFQKKMNQIVKSAKNIETINSNKGHQKQQVSEIQTLHRQHKKQEAIQIKEKERILYNQLIEKTSSLTGDIIKSIVNENQQKFDIVNQRIQGNLMDQEKRFQLKLEQRKGKKGLKKSLSSVEFPNKSTKDSLFNDGEEEVREIIDFNFSSIINENSDDDESGVTMNGRMKGTST